MSCKHETPEWYLVADKEGIVKRGVGCFRVIIADTLHPECVREGCHIREEVQRIEMP